MGKRSADRNSEDEREESKTRGESSDTLKKDGV